VLLDYAFLATHLLFAYLAGGAPLCLILNATLGDHAEGVLGREYFPIRQRFFDLAGPGSYLFALLASLGDCWAAVLLPALPKFIDVGDPKTRPTRALIDPVASPRLGIDFLS
jgi:hypothetical protein